MVDDYKQDFYGIEKKEQIDEDFKIKETESSEVQKLMDLPPYFGSLTRAVSTYPEKELLRHYRITISQSNLEQLGIFLSALEIMDEREKRYKELWKKDGWKGNLFHVKSKFMRMWQQFWIDEGRSEVEGKSELDDAYDLLNYVAFFLRNYNENNEKGSL